MILAGLKPLRLLRLPLLALLLGLLSLLGISFPARASLAPPASWSVGWLPIAQTVVELHASTYSDSAFHSPDGIGKFYMGREIAEVMGHQGAGWLERSSRESEEQPQRLVHALNLQPDAVVADIGAGTGYLSFKISSEVPEGKVLAVDIQPEMLAIIEQVKQARQVTNVFTVQGSPLDPHLPPQSIDLALMVDAYHEFTYPREMMQAIVTALKPNGRVVLAEYQGENPFVFIKPLHKMTQDQVRREMEAVGLSWQDTKNMLPQQHLMIFQKAIF